MDREKWGTVRGMLFAGLGFIAVLVGGTMSLVLYRAGQSYQAAVDRCHDAGGAWVAAGQHSYTGRCLRTPETPSWPPSSKL